MAPVRALCALLTLFLGACAQNFPRPAGKCCADGPSGNEIFDATFRAHGGAQLEKLNDLHLELDGDWKFLITRIQPLVTDHRYRVRSQETILPGDRAYHARYAGPDGSKWVLRTPDRIEVFYNGEASSDEDVLRSTALTADAFYHFSLGPMGLPTDLDWQRLDDARHAGQDYLRIYAELTPGFGVSPRDEIVLWVHPETRLTFRTHITLEGYRTTRGAHVDVTFLDYRTLDGFTLPSQFFERVLGPISIDAHAWEATSIAINRGTRLETLPRP